MRYDPSKYEDVATRLQRIHSVNPKLRIITEIAWHDDEFSKVCFKASLIEDDTVLSTGYAMDWKSKDRGATTTNWVETSETSAIGRCIANSKYQDKDAERPSKQEMEIASNRRAEASPTPKPKASPTPEPKPTAEVIKELDKEKSLSKIVGKNEDAVNKFLKGRKQITAKQTYRDVSDAYAKSIIEFPAKFLALALASDSKD